MHSRIFGRKHSVFPSIHKAFYAKNIRRARIRQTKPPLNFHARVYGFPAPHEKSPFEGETRRRVGVSSTIP